MPHYYFQIRDGDDLIRDDEGIELPDLSAARREAVLSARDIVSDAIGTAEPWDHAAIEIWEGARLVEVIQLGVLFTQERGAKSDGTAG